MSRCALGPAAFAGRTNILRPFWELSNAGEYPDHAGQVWAEPDVAAAARAMASIVDDPAAAEVRASAGQAFIKTHHSLAAVGGQMRDRLVTLGLL